jgi:hypothetical protein
MSVGSPAKMTKLYWLASSRELLKLSLLQADLQRIRYGISDTPAMARAETMVDTHDPDIEKLWYGVDMLCKVQSK